MISVIVPVYNVAEFLPGCIDSILKQTYRSIELILVDDGSSDDSGKICDKYALLDNRITVIHKANGGVSSARNMGLDTAHGDYIAFVDSDDQIEPEMYERLLADAERTARDIICCGSVTVGLDGKQWGYRQAQSGTWSRETVISSYFTEGIIKKTMYPPWNKLFRRSCIGEKRFKPYRYGEDILFVFEVLLGSNGVYFDSFPGYRYLRRENSAMTTRFSAARIDYIKAARELESLCSAEFPEASASAQRWVYQHVLVIARHAVQDNYQSISREYVRKEIVYLTENRRLLRKLPGRRTLDYLGVKYVHSYFKVLSWVKKHAFHP